MGHEQETEIDALWKEYGQVFRDFDDLTLARWMAQTLAQFRGRVWRLSHPLVACYRLAARAANERQVWLKRLVAVPADYPESACCGAPVLPLLTRDIIQCGLACLHCDGTAVPLDEIPSDLLPSIRNWAEQYQQVHAVAHWDQTQQNSVSSYEQELDAAAEKAQELLSIARRELAPKLLELYPAIVWEDQDECLEVQPEDVRF